MGFTVEEQILAVVVGVLATFLANKMGADGSGSKDDMQADLREITRVQSQLVNAGTEIVEAPKDAATKGASLLAAGDKKGLELLAERTASLRGAYVESYIENNPDVDPSTISLPLPDSDARAVNLGTKDELVRDLGEVITMSILTVERVTDMAVLNPLPRSPKDPYYQYIYLTWPSHPYPVYVVVVNTDISGVVEYTTMGWDGAGSVYNLRVKKKTYEQLKNGECKILFTTSNVAELGATGIALKHGVSIGKAPPPKTKTPDAWICYSYTGETSVKG